MNLTEGQKQALSHQEPAPTSTHSGAWSLPPPSPRLRTLRQLGPGPACLQGAPDPAGSSRCPHHCPAPWGAGRVTSLGGLMEQPPRYSAFAIHGSSRDCIRARLSLVMNVACFPEKNGPWMQSDRAQGGTRPFPGLITRAWPEAITSGLAVALELDSFLGLSGVPQRLLCSASTLHSLPRTVPATVSATALPERLNLRVST